MNNWLSDYVKAQKAALDSIPVDAVTQIVGKLRTALREDRQIFVFGNGGSAANASHFATDLARARPTKWGRVSVACRSTTT
jgi:D-sedoheptulose 7-phosphate isomerase